MPTPIAVNLREAETLTGISAYQLRDACRRGTLPSRKNGTKYLIRVADLDAWLDTLPSGADQEPGQ